MTIKRGTAYRTRANARNFTHEEAQKRLDETVKPFNKQVINALNVDYVECSYFAVQDRTGRPCSCQKQKIDKEDAHTNVPVSTPMSKGGTSTFELVLQDTDFMGERESAQRTTMDVTGDTPNVEANSGHGENQGFEEKINDFDEHFNTQVTSLHANLDESIGHIRASTASIKELESLNSTTQESLAKLTKVIQNIELGI